MNVTHTTEGEIPHAEVILPCGTSFLAPVAVELEIKNGVTIHAPVKEGGVYLYAVPGGRRLTKAQIMEIGGGAQ